MKIQTQGYRYGKKWGKPTEEQCNHNAPQKSVGVSSVDNDWVCSKCGKQYKTLKK